MAHASGPDPTFWGYVVHILQAIWTIGVVLIGWLVARFSNIQKHIRKNSEDTKSLERIHLRDQISLHQDFATKSEVRAAVHEAVTPVQNAVDRIERKLDDMVQRHMKL